MLKLYALSAAIAAMTLETATPPRTPVRSKKRCCRYPRVNTDEWYIHSVAETVIEYEGG